MLLCRVDVLCRLTIEPERMGLGPVEILAAAVVPRPSLIDVSMAATARLSAIILFAPPGAGNWLWRSFDEDMLLWRSSKLGDGRKSKEPLGLSSIPPKEKRLWLLRRLALRVVSLVEPARGLDVGS
jgi:hypothetical protein